MTGIPGLLQKEIDGAAEALMDDIVGAVEPALARFRARVIGAAERAVRATVEGVFARVAGPGEDVPRKGRTGPQEAAEPAARVIEFLQTHPGATTREVARSLGMHTSTLRSHLRKLIDEGEIQSRGDLARGAPRRHTFFVASRDVQHVNIEHVELERVDVPVERTTPVEVLA